MLRTRLIRVLGFSLAGLVALSIGTRPALKAQAPSAVVSTSVVAGAFGGSDQDGESKIPHVYLPARAMTIAESKTRMKLHDKIPMNFPNETPLEDVKKYIEQGTIDKADFPEGIAMYFDPAGLADADKTMASTIQIDLKNMPLETTLKLLLKQLNLTYWVNKDGLLIVTADTDDLVTPSSLDYEILSNLSALRAEVRALRSEVLHARRGTVPEERTTSRPPAASGMGGGGAAGLR